jgi:hypothetical protein
MDNDDTQLVFQKVLGQVLFYPPNVAGWPGGRNWIDSSTLMVRLQIPQALASNDAIDIRPKTDDDNAMGMMEEKRIRVGKNAAFKKSGMSAAINWVMVNKIFENTPRPALAQTITNALLQTKGKVGDELLAKYLNNESRESFIKSAIINLMSSPEYQLC